MTGRLTFYLLAAEALCAAEPRFVMQYFYDQDKSELQLADFKFPSARHGMAAGIISTAKKSEPALLITTDGGAHWTVAQLKGTLSSKDLPLSLHFVNENEGWMVTERGLWYTGDFGSTWRKTGDLPKGI
jgi:photosystem II stability/assembly factor-like uncharacterized protein